MAAFGALATAAVIAVNAILDRRDRREQAYRANLVPTADCDPTIDMLVLAVRNHGPWHARSVRLRVRAPEDGRSGGAPVIKDTYDPDTCITEPIHPAGGTWAVQVAWTEAWSEGRDLGVDLWWDEDSGRKQHLSIDLPAPIR